ncbi:MAG TPA: hypothetical protein VF250_02770 [Conexibacter sp.]
MFLSGRPLLDTAPDQARRLERQEQAPVVRGLAHGLNTLLLGAPGSGKTTLLHAVVGELTRNEPMRAHYLNTTRFDDPLDVLEATRDMLQPFGRELPRRPSADAALDALSTLRPRQPTAVVLDGLHPRLSHALFGRLRDETWQTGVTWAVSGDADRRSEYLTPPADAFFEKVVALEPLTAEQQRELIERRLQPGDRELDDIHVASGNPRALLATLRTIVESGTLDGEPLLVARANRQARADRLGRLHALVLAELEDGAVVSAADDTFRTRFGISRQRAQQVLSELEGAGLADSIVGKGPNGGRPRKLYHGVGP